MAEIEIKKKNLIKYAVMAVIVSGIAVFAVFYADSIGREKPAKDRVISVLEHGINTSGSAYSDEEIRNKAEAINSKLNALYSAENVRVESVVELADMARDLNDYDAALDLYAIADSMNPTDLFYKIDRGWIYLERRQWERARQEFELLKTSFPVHETYLGLAEAYQNIDGTPRYIIDDIYKEGLQRNFNRSELLSAFIDWLEETDREAETLQYYEIWNNQAPQQVLQEKINRLKHKYPDA